MTSEYAAILLAAGFSSRMEKFKPLLPIGEETLAGRVISLFVNCQVNVILVVGWRGEELVNAFANRDILIVENPDFRQGMFTSVIAGLDRIKPDHKAFFVMPVDIPLVRPATIKHLLKEAERQPGKILYPVFGNHRGHPTLIPCSLSEEIKNWRKDGGLRAVLQTYEDTARQVPVADSFILYDVDTPQQYAHLLELFQCYDIPTQEECEQILTAICQVDQERQRHCLKVSEVAALIGQALQSCGNKIDLELIRSAALLHDIAKGKSKHDVTGGRILRDMGFDRVGEIVGVHSDLAGGKTSLSLEAKVVFLADKFVQGEKLVTLEERYSTAGRRFALTAETKALILKRRETAREVKIELEEMLGCSLQKIITT
jgi:molybdenum cofactor cytidylyltransferase